MQGSSFISLFPVFFCPSVSNTQNHRDWKGPLEIPQSSPTPEAVLYSLSTGEHPDGFGCLQEGDPHLSGKQHQGSALLTAQQFFLMLRWHSLGCSLC